MMQEENRPKDKWQLSLDAEIDLLKECQKKHNLNTCMMCSKILDCEIRDKYIKIVYESMNKGSGGGFEF